MASLRTPSRSISDLATLTPARVALGRCGASLPTRALLDFTLDHARARDAVHTVFDAQTLLAELSNLGLRPLEVTSRAGDRSNYLRRPDLGRRLEQASAQRLANCAAAPARVAIVVGDGLSATAVHAHAIPLLGSLLPRLAAAAIEPGEVVLASGARVALGDEIGALLKAAMVVMLIGERPGLSAPDSLGVYLTFAPEIGRTDADRNCVSNIHRRGLGYEEAARKVAWLIGEGLARKMTGVALKDESGGGTSHRVTDNSASWQIRNLRQENPRLR